MRILITGKGGKAGSWAIRAAQIGDALGATVLPMASDEAIRRHDLVIVVKRTPHPLIRRIQASGVPWVYDIVDPWPQPAGNAWTPAEARDWLRGHVAALHPRACIYTTPQQQADAAWPGVVIHHHARPRGELNPIRSTISRIGYEGRPDYIARITDHLAPKLPAGVQIVINPAQLSDVDVLLAMRSGVWDGYAPRNWKSNVKLANAQSTGTPIICANEAGYADTASGAECWADTASEAMAALHALGPRSVRIEISHRLRSHGRRYALHEIAGQYREFLQSVVK